MKIPTPESLRSVLVTDCGSTTTKALLFQKGADGWRHTSRGEAPTTVEAPVADVTVGAVNAFTEVQELSGRKILAPPGGETPFLPGDASDSEGIDLYLSTSSAGGGLQMMVAGVVGKMSTESAARAALGAGAIVMDAISADDGREEHERVERLRHLRPDIVLLCGGVDGGSKNHVIEMAEVIVAASPRPRFGDTLKLPVVYAGNNECAEEVSRILSRTASVTVVPNVRPTLEREELAPAREAIHELFLSHVMSHSPGYGTLLSWTPCPVLPTPAAVGDMVQHYARTHGVQVLSADIGGATTDVFSVCRGADGAPVFNRTVSANYGMSYSVANVLIEAGTAAIMRWLPYEISETEVRDQLRNKMIRPTTIPHTEEDLFLEQAVCREALRLSLQHHRSLAVGLSGVQQRRGIGDLFAQTSNRTELVQMMNLDVVIGSGGVLSHAPQRIQSALMMLDGFELEGLTQISVNSIFMMPHLGVLSQIHPHAAAQIFERDCVVHIAHGIVPVVRSRRRTGTLCTVAVNGEVVGTVERGEVRLIPWNRGERVLLTITPSAHEVNVGAGEGQVLSREVITGECGFILDGRNRPIEHATTDAARIQAQQAVFRALGILR